MEWNTYQMLEKTAERERRERGTPKGAKKVKKRNCQAKIEQNEWQARQNELK